MTVTVWSLAVARPRLAADATVLRLVNDGDLSAQDRASWTGAAAGDALQQQLLVERAWRLASFRLRGFQPEERDEIRQNIAAAVLRALASGVVPERNLDGLLEWRARAEITAFVRTRMRSRRLLEPAADLEAAGHDPAPFDHVAADELRAQLQDCIERIPNADHREALRHRLLDGWAPQEHAQARAVPSSVVRVWLARGASLVRQCLERKLGHGRGVG